MIQREEHCCYATKALQIMLKTDGDFGSNNKKRQSSLSAQLFESQKRRVVAEAVMANAVLVGGGMHASLPSDGCHSPPIRRRLSDGAEPKQTTPSRRTLSWPASSSSSSSSSSCAKASSKSSSDPFNMGDILEASRQLEEEETAFPAVKWPEDSGDCDDDGTAVSSDASFSTFEEKECEDDDDEDSSRQTRKRPCRGLTRSGRSLDLMSLRKMPRSSGRGRRDRRAEARYCDDQSFDDSRSHRTLSL